MAKRRHSSIHPCYHFNPADFLALDLAMLHRRLNIASLPGSSCSWDGFFYIASLSLWWDKDTSAKFQETGCLTGLGLFCAIGDEGAGAVSINLFPLLLCREAYRHRWANLTLLTCESSTGTNSRLQTTEFQAKSKNPSSFWKTASLCGCRQSRFAFFFWGGAEGGSTLTDRYISCHLHLLLALYSSFFKKSPIQH